ncbi:MAG: GFA family protein [Myxococcota bacterium]
MGEPVKGSCLCGTVRFEIELPTLFCGHCHCTMCQRAHGAGYVTWIGVARKNFRMVSGGETLIPYKSSDHGTRSFCANCGSSLFCESTTHPDHIDIVLANVEGEIDREPAGHWYYSDQAAWTRVNDELPKLGGESGVEPL